MTMQAAMITPDGSGGFRCSVCKNRVQPNSASCESCGRPFVGGATAQAIRQTAAVAPAQPIFDRPEQLQQIKEILLPSEQIDAVFDLKGTGTGFIGITTKRVIFHDKQFMRKLKAIVSIPYSRIISIATENEAGLLTGRGFFGSSRIFIVTSHGEHEFEFRGADKAQTAHNMILGRMVN